MSYTDLLDETDVLDCTFRLEFTGTTVDTLIVRSLYAALLFLIIPVTLVPTLKRQSKIKHICNLLAFNIT